MAKQTTSTPRGGTTTRSGAAGRKAGVATPVSSERRRAPSALTFFQESRAELRKVTWPTRHEATNLTMAVIVMTVSIAIFLGAIDTTLDYLVKPLLGAK